MEFLPAAAGAIETLSYFQKMLTLDCPEVHFLQEHVGLVFAEKQQGRDNVTLVRS